MKKRILISIIACSLLSGQAIHGMTSAPAVQNAVRTAPNKEAAVKLIIDNNLENKFGGAALRAFVPLYGPWATAKADYLAAKKAGPPPPGGPSVDDINLAKSRIKSTNTIDQLNYVWSDIGRTVGLQVVVQDDYNDKKAQLEQAIKDAINAINRAAKKEDLTDVWNKLPDPVKLEIKVRNAHRDKEALLTLAPPPPIIEKPKNVGEIIKFVNDNIEKDLKGIYHNLKQLYNDGKDGVITKEELEKIMEGFGFVGDEGVKWITNTSW